MKKYYRITPTRQPLNISLFGDSTTDIVYPINAAGKSGNCTIDFNRFYEGNIKIYYNSLLLISLPFDFKVTDFTIAESIYTIVDVDEYRLRMKKLGQDDIVYAFDPIVVQLKPGSDFKQTFNNVTYSNIDNSKDICFDKLNIMRSTNDFCIARSGYSIIGSTAINDGEYYYADIFAADYYYNSIPSNYLSYDSTTKSGFMPFISRHIYRSEHTSSIDKPITVNDALNIKEVSSYYVRGKITSVDTSKSGYTIVYISDDDNGPQLELKLTSKDAARLDLSGKIGCFITAFHRNFTVHSDTTDTFQLYIDDPANALASVTIRTDEGFGNYFEHALDVMIPDGYNAKATLATIDENNKLRFNYEFGPGSIIPHDTPVMFSACRKTTIPLIVVTGKPDDSHYTFMNQYAGNFLFASEDGGMIQPEEGYRYYKLAYDNFDTKEGIGWYWGAENGGPFKLPKNGVALKLPITCTGSDVLVSTPYDDIIYINYKITQDVIDAYKDLGVDVSVHGVPVVTRCDLYDSIKIDGVTQKLTDKEHIPYAFKQTELGPIMDEACTLLFKNPDNVSEGYNNKYVITVPATLNTEGTIELKLKHDLPYESMHAMFFHNKHIRKILIGKYVFYSSMYMFDSCSNIMLFNINIINTKLDKNAACMFNGCRSIKTLNISELDTSDVTDMTRMFNNCTSLTELDLSSFNTSNVKDFTHMFNNCRSLKSLNITSFNTSNATTMNGTFGNMFSLETLIIPNFDTSNVTDMSRLFYNSGLTYLDVSNFDVSKVVNKAGMFSASMSLKHIKCKKAFKDWCIANQIEIGLSPEMREGGSGTWEIVG